MAKKRNMKRKATSKGTKKAPATSTKRKLGKSNQSASAAKRKPAKRSSKASKTVRTFAKTIKSGDKSESVRMTKFVKGVKSKTITSKDGKRYEIKRIRFRLPKKGENRLDAFAAFLKRMNKTYGKDWVTWVDIPGQPAGSYVGTRENSQTYIAQKLEGEYAGARFKELRITGMRMVKGKGERRIKQHKGNVRRKRK